MLCSREKKKKKTPREKLVENLSTIKKLSPYAARDSESLYLIYLNELANAYIQTTYVVKRSKRKKKNAVYGRVLLLTLQTADSDRCSIDG